MRVLGLGGSNHDFASCIVTDGKIEVMASEERITRKKYGIGLGIDLAKGVSRKNCLNALNLNIEDIDLIVVNDILSKLMYGRINTQIHKINHHTSHAASAFFTSPFEEAAILVVDSVGSIFYIDNEEKYESTTYAYGANNKIEDLDKQLGRNLQKTDYIENSLGIFYSIITDVIGFGEHEEGKTMGLAPYGNDSFYCFLKNHFRLIDNGKVEMNESDIYAILDLRQEIEKENDLKKENIKKDIAFSAQKILTETLIHFAEHAKKITSMSNLCIVGGVALNSVANYKLHKSGIFENIFMVPASGDDGTAMGSALFGYYSILNNRRSID